MIESRTEFYDEGPRYQRAPSREDVAAIGDFKTLNDMLVNAEDQEISIKAQLEYLDDEDDLGLRRGRVNALIYWQKAIRYIKARMNELNAIKRTQNHGGKE